MTPAEIEQMRADMEAGTKGPWVGSGARYRMNGGDWVNVAEADTKWVIACVSANIGDLHAPADFRRLLRVPDMEAEILRLREALEEVSELSRYARHGGAMVDDLDNYERGLDEALRIADEALAGTKEDNA